MDNNSVQIQSQVAPSLVLPAVVSTVRAEVIFADAAKGRIDDFAPIIEQPHAFTSVVPLVVDAAGELVVLNAAFVAFTIVSESATLLRIQS